MALVTTVASIVVHHPTITVGKVSEEGEVPNLWTAVILIPGTITLVPVRNERKVTI
jgi:hypothetical protein